MNKKSILIIVIVGIIVIIGIILCDLFITREKRLDEVDYNYSKPIKAYNIKEENNDIILTWYLDDPFRRVTNYQFSDDILEQTIVTDYFENKFTAIFNYIYNYKEKYKDNDVKLKGNAIIYTQEVTPNVTKNDIKESIEYLSKGSQEINL